MPGYVEAGISGEELETRPQLQRLLTDAKAGLFDVIVVVSSSRLARDEYVHAFIKRALREAGVQVLNLEHPTEPKPRAAYFMDEDDDGLPAGVLALLDQHENRRRKRFTVAGLREVAERGYWCGGQSPFGFGLKMPPMAALLARSW